MEDNERNQNLSPKALISKASRKPLKVKEEEREGRL